MAPSRRYLEAALLLVVLSAGVALGQNRSMRATGPIGVAPDRPSHEPLGEGFAATEEQLLLRLHRARDLQKIQKLAQDLLKDRDLLEKLRQEIKPGDLERLRRKAQADPNSLLKDPALKPLLDQLRQDGRVSAEDLELFRRLAPNLPRPNPPDNRTQPPMPDVPMPRPDPPMPQPQPTPPPPTPTNNESTNGRSSSWWSRQVRQLSTRLKDMDAEDKAALTELVRQFSRGGGGDLRLDPNAGGRWPGMARALTRIGEIVPMDRIRPRDLLSATRGWRMPTLPRFSGGGGGPAISSGPRLAGDKIVAGVLWIVAGLAAAVLAWKLVQRYRTPLAATIDAAGLGPWPVEPSRVTSREEVVQAFEYLALRNLGPSARPCHHLAIAERLAPANEDQARREAARRLGAVYEQARYAPPSATLTEASIADVRRDLTALAEGPKA